MNVILASQSPRRRELLGLFSFPFTVQVADVDETMDTSAAPATEVARVSRLKAEAIPCGQEDVIIAADTIVVCDDRILGKPADEAEAFATLRLLSGRAHQVMTGVTVRTRERCISTTEITQVFFRALSDKEISRYIATKEPMDKAGSYGIQGGAALFAEKLVGDYFNVVGLPVCRLGQMLKEATPELMEGTP